MPQVNPFDFVETRACPLGLWLVSLWSWYYIDGAQLFFHSAQLCFPSEIINPGTDSFLPARKGRKSAISTLPGLSNLVVVF